MSALVCRKRKQPSTSSAPPPPPLFVSSQDLLPLPNDIVMAIFQFLTPWDWQAMLGPFTVEQAHKSSSQARSLLESTSFDNIGWSRIGRQRRLDGPLPKAKKIKTWRQVVQREMLSAECGFCGREFGNSTQGRKLWSKLCRACNRNPATNCLTQTEVRNSYGISAKTLRAHNVYHERLGLWYLYLESDVIALQQRLREQKGGRNGVARSRI